MRIKMSVSHTVEALNKIINPDKYLSNLLLFAHTDSEFKLNISPISIHLGILLMQSKWKI